MKMVLIPKKSRTVKYENESKKVFCVTKGARGRIEGDTEDVDRRLIPGEVADAREKLRRGFANDNTKDANRCLTPEEVADASERLRRGFANDNTKDANRCLTPEEVADASERLRRGFVDDNTEDANRLLTPKEIVKIDFGTSCCSSCIGEANRRLTPEEIADAREKIRKRFERLARRYGFVME